jgi:hypothetical protein
VTLAGTSFGAFPELEERDFDAFEAAPEQKGDDNGPGEKGQEPQWSSERHGGRGESQGSRGEGPGEEGKEEKC